MFTCVEHGWSNPMYACPVCHPVNFTTSDSSASGEPDVVTKGELVGWFDVYGIDEEVVDDFIEHFKGRMIG